MGEEKTSPETVRHRLPLFLSCLVFPGAGQALQRRWLPAALFSISFAACLAGLMMNVLVPLFRNVRVALDLAAGSASAGQFVSINPGRMVGWMTAGLIIYLLNAVDAYRHS